MPKKKQGIYATVPAVPQKKIAGLNPFSTPVVGTDLPTQVPKKQPRIAGFAGKRGYGHLPHQMAGHLRLSGHPGAHRLGAVKGSKR